MQNNTISVVKQNFLSDVRTRTSLEPELVYKQKDKISDKMKEFEVDFSAIVDKPYFVKQIPFTSAGRFSILDKIAIPTQIITNNLVRKPFETTAFYRTKLCLLLQIAGSPMHQGTVLAAAVPLSLRDNMSFTTFTRDSDLISSLMCAPHVFLSANENSSVCLEVPFYANTSVVRTDLYNNTVNAFTEDFAEVLFMVINPLGVPVGGSTAVSISVHAMFKESEFYVPHVDPNFSSNLNGLSSKEPSLNFKAEASIVSQAIDSITSVAHKTSSDLIDAAREGVRHYTGLDNANVPFVSQRVVTTQQQFFNCVDSATFYEKLDPFFQYDRVPKDVIFDTLTDEMDMKYICKKPAYLGTFKVTSSDTTGTLLWSRPITPFQNSYTNESGTNHILTHPLEKLSYLTKYWSGGLKIHIQANMTNFHFAKLILARNYSPVKQQQVQYPGFQDLQNLICSSSEFSAGGQVQTFELPYMSIFPYMNCTVDWIANALQHGMYYIYLAQPLVYSGAVPTTVEFNVYISAGDDFQLYGYSTELASRYYNNPTALSKNGKKEFFAEAAIAPMPVSDQTPLTLDIASPATSYDEDLLRPITSIRDIFRRPMACFSGDRGLINANGAAIFAFQVSSLMGLIQDRTIQFLSPLDILLGMFYGYKGGVKLRIAISGQNQVVNFYYYPPTMCFDFNNVDIIRANEGAATGASGADVAANNFMTKIHDPLPLGRGVPRAVTVVKQNVDFRVNVGNQIAYWDLLIPNLNPSKFLGTTNRFRPTGSSTLNEYCSSMGVIQIAIEPSVAVTPNITIYVALADEARLGFQVLSIPIQIYGPASSFGSNTYHFSSTTDVNQIGGLVPPLPYSAQSTACPACYYTRS